jgi:hypothetical protein
MQPPRKTYKFLPRDPGWGKIKIQIRDEHPGSYFLELKKTIFVLQYLNSMLRIQIRDPGCAIEKIRIRAWIDIEDPQHLIYDSI